MAASLINVGISNIGVTPVVAYTVPPNKTSMLLGCTVTNITGSIAPLTVLVRKATLDVRLAKNRRVTDSLEIVVGKVVLSSGDSLIISAQIDQCFDALISIAEGV
jgi:hypothetical protein